MHRSSVTPWLLSLCAALLPCAAQAAHHCFPEPLYCGETRQGALDATECFLDEESWADFYTFTGPAGREVTITLSSSTVAPSLFLFSPQPELVAAPAARSPSITPWRAAACGGVEAWIEQIDTGQVRYYFLPGAGPTSSELPGFFDRNGFLP